MSLLDQLLEGCQLIDFDYRYLYLNDAAAKHGQMSRDAFIGHTMMELYPGIDATPMFSLLKQCMNDRKPIVMENEFKFPDGSTGWFELKMEPVPEGVFILSIDISERKQMDNALQRSMETLEDAEQIAGWGSWELDINGEQGFWSKQMFRMFGLEPADHSPSFEIYLERIHPADRPCVVEAHEQMAKGKEPTVNEYRSNPEYGPVRVFSPTWRCVRDSAGKPGKFMGTLLDITERKQVQKRVETQLQRMKSLHVIDISIANILEIQLMMTILVEAAVRQLDVDAADVMLFRPVSNMLEYAAGKGFRTDGMKKGSVRLGEGFAGRVALEQQKTYIPDLAEVGEKIACASLYAGEGFVVYSGVPLLAKGQLKGVLEVYHRTPLNPDDEWFNFLETIAGLAAIAIDNAQLFEGMQRSNINLALAYDATIEGWSRALDLRDRETEGHTQRVTDLAVQLAKAMGMSEDDIVHVRRGALLHDMGKLGVPDGILFKPDKLTDEEFVVMQQHSQYVFDMFSDIAYLKPALDIPYCHHERWDGTGYPRGLKGKQIPIAARLFAVVDVWDALLSSRPYHESWSKEKAQDYMRSQSGTHFDPQVVELFLSMMNDLEKIHR